MTKSTKLWVIVGLAFVVLYIYARRQSNPLVRDFSWSLEGSSVQYSLSLQNPVNEDFQGVIVLVAETKREADDGVTILPRGMHQLPISLAANEAKKIDGVFALNARGDSQLIVYPVVTQNDPNQPVQRTGAGARR
ncbi:MAG: hypothetical protein JNN01_06365 [Opitutaceae bacterium]|nr:hypothetical protein [Opitutaceae bacterium]